MEIEVKAENRYGVNVMENTFMDKLRKEQCLCLNCKKMPCEQSQVLYYVCKKSNLAMAITRCPDWVNKV